MKNFWQNLPRPFVALAPLDGVTDVVFRQMMTRLGKPDVMFTEFTSCEGLQSDGFDRVSENLLFKPNEQPVVAQLWGINPSNFYKSAKYVKKLGFSGIDINMGCPHRTVIKDGACSALIHNRSLAREVIRATKEGGEGLPVSVKTRIGFETEDVEGWIGFLLKETLAALTVHLRTVSELSKVPAHWELMPQILQMRNSLSPETVLTGNGDITSLEEVSEKYKKHGCEGFMIGRGIFANPWLFNRSQTIEDISQQVRFDTYLQHIVLFEKMWGNSKNPANLKKYCKAYINNFPEASSFRDKIMETKTLAELLETVVAFQEASRKQAPGE